jgi:penicillin-binding protein 1A
MMNQMMHETLTSGTAHSAQLAGWPAAGKTGTSQDFRDAWFIGYTGHLVTGVWLGNDDSSPTRKATGGGLPVEIWSHFMKPAHQGVAVVALPEIETGGLSLTAMLGGPAAAPGGTPVPPAPIGVSSSGPARTDHSTSLDGWLLDRLFGRH